MGRGQGEWFVTRGASPSHSDICIMTFVVSACMYMYMYMYMVVVVPFVCVFTAMAV